MGAASLVLATAFDVGELRTRPRAELADVIISKPVTASMLHDAVVQALGRRRPDSSQLGVRALSPLVQRLPGVRVLVADDSDINREIARRILELEGAIVREARDGLEAVE